MGRTIFLKLLRPAFVDAIVEGNLPLGTNLQMLMDGRIALSSSWSDQEEPFGD
jgi:hypothetical protein